ncbi:MAG: porphobilinogen deaminase [Gemmatales bacterium]|nr:MAG: porphobilinogen deaminase [Gemmatales bacterium]
MIRLGTRGSRLALWQAEHVRQMLVPLCGKDGVEIVEIQTTGDRARNVPLAHVGGEGVFTKEIQNALIEKRIDVAVHSLKDLPTSSVPELLLAAVPKRGPVADVFVSNRYPSFDDLPRGASLATSSPRRKAQAWRKRPDLRIVDIRGNVETRLRKLDEQELDGILLALAGLERLGFIDRVTEILDTSWMLPAVGQGALGLECRRDDQAIIDLLAQLNHSPTRQAVDGERSFLRHLGGGCQVPIAVFSDCKGEQLELRGAVLSPDGTKCATGQKTGAIHLAEQLGKELAEDLLRQGAAELLDG